MSIPGSNHSNVGDVGDISDATHDVVSHAKDCYTLLRLILVDSLTPGRIVELPLLGGAVLTGRNGRGKTSLLQLLLLFYGESPSKIVTTEAGRDSFVGYYLPRTTSYIAFEYQRPGGYKRLVVAYSDRSGERVLYRFVRGGYEVGQFIRSDGDFVKNADFKTHLQTTGFQCADRQIESQSEYRQIIQGVPSTTTDRAVLKSMREMTQEYSFTAARKPLRQIEKIVSGMFRRKTNFDDLQSMVIDCVSDELSSHSVSGDRRKIEDWPRGYKAYMSVMTLAPQMLKAQDADNQLQAAESLMGEIASKFRSLIIHLDQRIHEKTKSKIKIEFELDARKTLHQQTILEVSAQQSTALNNNEFFENKVKALEKAHEYYEKKNIKALDVRVKNVQYLQDGLLQHERHRAALLSQQSEIVIHFEQLKQSAKDEFGQIRDDQNAERQRAMESFEAMVSKLDELFEQSDRLSKEESISGRKQLDDDVQLAHSQHGRALQGVERPQPESDKLELLEVKQKELEKVRAEKLRVTAQQRVFEDSYRQAMYEFQGQENTVSTALRQVTDAEKDLLDKRQQLVPKEGSLLHFLRLNRTDWSGDIAKVIKGDLLDRTDLSPGITQSSEKSDSFFGLSLDLERLSAHPSSDVSEAEQEVEISQERLKQAQAVLEKARALLVQISGLRETAEKSRQLHELVIQKANSKVQVAQSEVDESKRQVEASKLEAKNLAQKVLDDAKKILDESKKKLSLFDDLFQARNNGLRSAHHQKKQEKKKDRDNKVDLINGRIAIEQKKFQANCQQYDIDRNQSLLNKGIDTGKLQSIDSDMAAAKNELIAIRGFSEEVYKWHFWLENEWEHLEDFTGEAAKFRTDYQTYSQTIAQMTVQWQSQSKDMQDQFKSSGLELMGLDEQRRLVSQRVDAMTGYTEVCAPDYEESWTFDLLSTMANRCSRDISQSLESIRRIVGEIASGFRVYQGTPPEQYLQTSLATLSPTPSRQWLEPLNRWFSQSHREYQRILLMEAVSIAGEVNAFHRSMEQFHLRVQQFNRELQEHLDTSLAFESISKVRVEVVSTIKELKYWTAICEMAESHRVWSRMDSNDLPPPEFAMTIERLLEHWEVKTGIRADLKSLIRIQGEVTENGNRRVFKRASDLETVSSNGLSYLVLATIFVAFINRIRRGAKVNIIWALDELKDLDSVNVVALLELLKRNHITLACAFPDPDPETMALFEHRFTIEPDRRLAQVRVAMADMENMQDLEDLEDVEDDSSEDSELFEHSDDSIRSMATQNNPESTHV